MAEAIGIVASIIAISTAGKDIAKVVRTLRHAPEELLATCNEVSDLVQFLSSLQGIIPPSQPIDSGIQATLDKAVIEINQLKNVIRTPETLAPSRHVTNRVQWYANRRAIRDHQAAFRELRLQLMALLSAQNMSV
ncbi:hypothetical protein FGRMN_9006 [Fusarium graminum]|nr:hypothetical protein FGRMN_9006 [Fusarium graminum]